MNYIDPGAVPQAVLEFAKTLPKFSDGRIDYTHARSAAVVNCLVLYEKNVLLLLRSDKVGWMKNKWHVIAGFLDEEKPLGEKSLDEMVEETKIKRELIKSVRCLAPYHDPDADKDWIVHTVVIELLAAPTIILDWENTTYEWARPSDVAKYGMVGSLANIIRGL